MARKGKGACTGSLGVVDDDGTDLKKVRGKVEASGDSGGDVQWSWYGRDDTLDLGPGAHAIPGWATPSRKSREGKEHVKGGTVRAFSSSAECPVDRVKKEPGKVENMVDGAVDRG